MIHTSCMFRRQPVTLESWDRFLDGCKALEKGQHEYQTYFQYKGPPTTVYMYPSKTVTFNDTDFDVETMLHSLVIVNTTYTPPSPPIPSDSDGSALSPPITDDSNIPFQHFPVINSPTDTWFYYHIMPEFWKTFERHLKHYQQKFSVCG